MPPITDTLTMHPIELLLVGLAATLLLMIAVMHLRRRNNEGALSAANEDRWRLNCILDHLDDAVWSICPVSRQFRYLSPGTRNT